MTAIRAALHEWWTHHVLRSADRTPETVRETRQRLLQALNGELDTDLKELRAMLDSITYGDEPDHAH